MKRFLVASFVAALVVAGGAVKQAEAVPYLQMYVEGGTYDNSTQTWIANSPSNFKLWVIGNVAGPGGLGAIMNVHLAAAFQTGETGTISITGSTTTLVTDPSVSSNPVFVSTSDGTTPIDDSGAALPSHGVYGAGVSWNKYDLGDMNLTDSPIADFNGSESFPTVFSAASGQINVYDVSISGYSVVHFDAYNHVQTLKSIKSVNAPFSHDSETNAVPEPGTLILFGAGLMALAGFQLRRKK